MFHLVQIVIAIFRALESKEVNRSNGKKIQISLYESLKIFDGGLRNIWAFFILVIFVPLFLTSMGNIDPVLEVLDMSESNASCEGAASTNGTVTCNDRTDLIRLNPRSSVLYFICLAMVGVLITLEFSYVHNLRNSATEWVPMLLVALALDFATLLALTFVLENPHEWQAGLNWIVEIMMIVTTFLALLSSFMILVLARMKGALSDPRIVDDIGRELERRISPERTRNAGEGSDAE